MKHRKLHPIASLLVLALLFAPAVEAKKKKKKPKEREGAISGTVTNLQDEKLDGVLVAVAAAAPEGFRGEATTDKKGEFKLVIPDAEGVYQIRFSRQDYAPFETPVEFLPGERKVIDVSLIDEAAGRRKEAAALYNAGVQAFNAGDRAQAKEKFIAAADLDPELAEPLLPLADMLASEGDHAAAAERAEQYLALKPGDQKAQVIAHEAYRRLGNQAKVDELRSALGESGLSSQLAVQVFNEGAMASQKSDWDAAIAKFREAVELDPSLASAHGALAQIHYSREEFDASLAAAEKLLELDPENVQGRRYRYLVFDIRGDDGAAEALDAFGAVDPKGAAEVLYQIADLDFRRDDRTAAKAKALKAVELDPELPRAHYLLGQIYAQTDTAKAKVHLEKFIELAPDDPEVAMARGMMEYF